MLALLTHLKLTHLVNISQFFCGTSYTTACGHLPRFHAGNNYVK